MRLKLPDGPVLLFSLVSRWCAFAAYCQAVARSLPRMLTSLTCRLDQVRQQTDRPIQGLNSTRFGHWQKA